MKKVLTGLIMFILLLANVSFGATKYYTTVKAKGIGLKVSSGVGHEVTIIKKSPDIQGWNITPNTVQLQGDKFVMPASNVELNAIMETYIITLNGNGGTLTNTQEIFTAGTPKQITAIPTREGYVFLGWAGNELAKLPDIKLTEKYLATGNVTLYAVWELEAIPTVTVTKNKITSDSIEVNVQATDDKVGMPDTPLYSYYYKLTNESTYKLVPGKENIQDSSCKISGLVSGSIYDIKVTSKNKKGNLGEGYLKNIQTSLITGEINSSALTWSNGKASITLTTTSNHDIEYQIDSIDGEWTLGGNKNATINNINNNQTVYARLTDGTNVGEYIAIKIIDNINPEKALASDLPDTMVEGANLDVTITHIDNQSGIDLSKCKWVFNQNASNHIDESEYINSFGSSNTISIQNPGLAEYYLHILSVDNGNNKTETLFKIARCEGRTETTCKTCDGRGVLYYDTDCPTCTNGKCPGTPKLTSRTTSDCSSCGGKNTYVTQIYECPICHITGRGEKCSACGAGVAPTDNHKNAVCPDCRGRGVITHSRDCSDCQNGIIVGPCEHSKTSPHYYWKSNN